MIALPVVFLLLLGAATVPFLSPERHWLRIFPSLSPIVALVVLLIPFPIPNEFTLSWKPASLFPEPLVFQSNSDSSSFAVYFCLLLILIEWTRPLRRSAGALPRALCFLLTAAGVLACFTSNALAVVLVWTWIDLLSFISVLLLESPPEIGPGGISSSAARSIGILSINLLSNALILFPVLESPNTSGLEWSSVWQQSPSNVSLAFFLAGVSLRLLVFPVQLAFSRSGTSSAGIDTLLRILPPAIVLSLLSHAWPAQVLSPGGDSIRVWPLLFFSLALLLSGLQWWISSSPFSRRDSFLLLIPSLGIFSALLLPQPDGIFRATGAMVILGGGLILLYRGYLAHQRWTAFGPILIAVIQTGLVFSPLSFLVTGLIPNLWSSHNFGMLLLAILVQILIISAVFRIAFEPVEEFSPNEPYFFFLYGFGMILAIGFLFYPIPQSPSLNAFTILAPFIFLLVGGAFVLLARRFQREGENIFRGLGGFFRLEWVRPALSFAARNTTLFLSGMEDLFSGEGAMVWALGIAVLFLLAIKGG